jgi:hypothetical protein
VSLLLAQCREQVSAAPALVLLVPKLLYNSLARDNLCSGNAPGREEARMSELAIGANHEPDGKDG